MTVVGNIFVPVSFSSLIKPDCSFICVLVLEQGSSSYSSLHSFFIAQVQVSCIQSGLVERFLVTIMLIIFIII